VSAPAASANPAMEIVELVAREFGALNARFAALLIEINAIHLAAVNTPLPRLPSPDEWRISIPSFREAFSESSEPEKQPIT
jgi:hypothetical protein